MPCYNPLLAYREPTLSPTGKSIITFSPREAERLSPISLPCGRCVGCRLERSRQWAVRCMHEASLHEKNCFITLTYDDDHLPMNSSLDHKHFQDFMKVLRERVRSELVASGMSKAERKKFGIRYYMAGEYGEEFGRPHFHACLFNYDFPDKEKWKTIKGNQYYVSKMLSAIWPHGYSTISDVTFESAAYVSRYIMKKITGDKAEEHYEYLNEFGEYVQRTPEYNKMSLKPGIGKDWLTKYVSDVYPLDAVIVRGKETKPPKYYDKLYEISYPSDFEEIKWKRLQAARLNSDNNTPERLAVREKVALAKLDRLKRSLK